MKANQIASMLNEIYGEIIGESEPIAEDLANIVSVGKTITDSTQFGENFDSYVKKIIDKVGQTIFRVDEENTDMPPILHDAWSYGSILEKIRADVGEYVENKVYDLASPMTFDDLYGFKPATINVTYFNIKSVFELDITIARKQVESAFRSASAINSFVSMIEARINKKREMAIRALAQRAVNNMILEKVKSNNNVVNLLAAYKTTTGNDTITANTAIHDKEFLTFAVGEMLKYKKFLAGDTMLYNDSGYVTNTPESRLMMYLNTDLATAFKTVLLANTYNAEFVDIGGYYEVGFWQSMGTGGTFAQRTEITAIPASEGLAPAEGDDTRQTYTATGVVGVMFDEWACMVANEEPNVESIYNPKKRFWNFFHQFEASYYNDLAENCVVFTIADE